MMAKFEALNDEALGSASGGAATAKTVNTTNWQGAHRQAEQYDMGTEFTAHGFLWYRIKSGDTLSAIAKTYGTTTAQLKIINPATIVDINKIDAGDAIMIRRA